MGSLQTQERRRRRRSSPDWGHYLGRLVDRVVAPLTPATKKLALQYQRHVFLDWEPEVRSLWNYVPAGGFAVDVGANIGLWSYAMTTSGLFEGILAFEPNAALTDDLRRAGLPNVRVIHKALSDAAGAAVFRIPHRNGIALAGWGSLESTIDLQADGFQEMLVETTRLDDEVWHPVSFIKIDVEGHELAVLRGATDVIRRGRPMCLIECRARNTPAVERWFKELEAGYSCIDTRAEFGIDLTSGNLLFGAKQ